MHPRITRIVVLVVAAIALVGATGLRVIDGIATDNLSSDDFDRNDPWHPRDTGLDAQALQLQFGSIPLVGWWLPGSSDAVVILVHGHAGTMGDAGERWAPMLHAAGYHVAAFDLPGHGASGGDGVTYGPREAAALSVVAQHVHDGGLGFVPGHVAFMGGSMGAVTVLLAAESGLADAVIADSGYPTLRWQALRDGADAGYPVWLIDLVMERMDRMASYPPSEADAEAAAGVVSAAGVPLMLAHCTDDTRIAFAAFERLQAAAPGATTWTGACPTGLSDFNHVDGWAQPGYNATVLAFLDDAWA